MKEVLKGVLIGMGSTVLAILIMALFIDKPINDKVNNLETEVKALKQDSLNHYEVEKQLLENDLKFIKVLEILIVSKGAAL